MSKLDLKYRPRKFSEVLGNAGVRRLLLARSRSGTLGDQSMMFGGPKGCGKTTMARIVARAMLCVDLDDGEPCGSCHVCSSVLEDSCPSVEEMDAASQGTVDRIRSMVSDSDYGTIDGSDRRVYIIDEAQRLSKAAQDALLKAVEGRFFIVILCTTEPQNIKGPIRDRMEEYPVYPPDADELAARLSDVCTEESIQFEPDALDLVVKMNGRTPRSCLLSVSALGSLGPITSSSVREYFRFNSYVFVDRVLSLLDSDPALAFDSLDSLSSMEGPTWIRDAIVFAIASGLRVDVGARSAYPVDLHFFSVRGRSWLSLAHDLGRIDRPSMADIEASLMSVPVGAIIPSSVFPVPSNASTLVLPSPPAPSKAPASVLPSPPAKTSVPVRSETNGSVTVASVSDNGPGAASPSDKDRVVNKELEIEGVTYSSRESLTTLDNKISASSSVDKTEDRESTPVGLDGSRVPITEKEFVSSFLGKFRRI